MTVEYKDINNIFPLIDDPMNIFYSKIKQWMQLNSNFHLHCRATSRVDREINCSFNGITRLYKCKFKTFNFLKEEDIGHYLYVRFLVVIPSKSTAEMTTSGEVIPVDISDISIQENSPVPVILHDHNENILYTEYGTLSYYVYIRVNKVYRNRYNFLDIESTEIDYHELHFETSYHKSIGRLWLLKPRSSEDTSKQSVLDSNFSWYLYNVDSEDSYTLIDHSETLPKNFGSTILWPVQYGAGLDHRSKFNYYQGYGGSHPLLDTPSGYTWFEIRESEWTLSYPEHDVYNKNTEVFADLREEADPFLNTRGIVPSLFPSLFNGLSFRSKPDRLNYYPSIEGVVLLLSYICNMNPRYLLCSTKDKPLNQVVNPPVSSNYSPSYLLGWSDSSNIYSMANVCLHGWEMGVDYSVALIELKTNLSSTAPNYSKVKAAYDNMEKHVLDSDFCYIGQNFLPHEVFPNVRWYLHQWVYALSFKKYATFHFDENKKLLYWDPPFPDIIDRYTRKYSFTCHIDNSFNFFKDNFLS